MLTLVMQRLTMHADPGVQILIMHADPGGAEADEHGDHHLCGPQQPDTANLRALRQVL